MFSSFTELIQDAQDHIFQSICILKTQLLLICSGQTCAPFLALYMRASNHIPRKPPPPHKFCKPNLFGLYASLRDTKHHDGRHQHRINFSRTMFIYVTKTRSLFCGPCQPYPSILTAAKSEAKTLQKTKLFNICKVSSSKQVHHGHLNKHQSQKGKKKVH